MAEPFEYINKTYGLSLKRGSRVEYTGDKGGPKQGIVTTAAGQYINVRFDGTMKSVGPFHPTWEMRQIEAEPSVPREPWSIEPLAIKGATRKHPQMTEELKPEQTEREALIDAIFSEREKTVIFGRRSARDISADDLMTQAHRLRSFATGMIACDCDKPSAADLYAVLSDLLTANADGQDPEVYWSALQRARDVRDRYRLYAADALEADAPSHPAAVAVTDEMVERVSVPYDGFSGDVIGSYITREGKQGVVVQQDGTRVVHVYGRSRIEAALVDRDRVK